ncbi:MAG: hypothetical protein JW770_06580 [Actinobacteria bacterium]|nr:hypothetical protein [Actinomycetota bacterium]
MRISFCGGGTDPGYCYNENGGLVLSATINKFAQGGSFIKRDDGGQSIKSSDYDEKNLTGITLYGKSGKVSWK